MRAYVESVFKIHTCRGTFVTADLFQELKGTLLKQLSAHNT